MIRLIATDLDGTIVRSDGSVSERILSAFKVAESRGIRVVFATGRPPRWMFEVVEATGQDGVAICANGAYFYDLAKRQVLETFAMSADDALEAIVRIRKALPEAAFGVEILDGFGHEAAYQPRWNPEPLLGIGPIEDFLIQPVAKLLVRDDTQTGDVMLNEATAVLDGLVEVTHSNTNDSLLEVSALGVNKGSALHRLAEEWGISSAETVAFGDMPNDAPMLAWAGASYAMGNSHPAAIAAAGETIGTIDGDAVADVLEEILEISAP